MSKCKKLENVLVDVKVYAEFPNLFKWHRYIHGRLPTPEEKAKELESAVMEFKDFIRDHRSQDPVELYVERVTQPLCSVCENEWDQVEENGVLYCAHCGAEVEQKPCTANAPAEGRREATYPPADCSALVDGMQCPHCGGRNTSILPLGGGYGDGFCDDCKKWCGFEELPNTVIGQSQTSKD